MDASKMRVDITTDGYRHITLFDNFEVSVVGNKDKAEIVIHPSSVGNLTIRAAKEPYRCKIFLANGNCLEIDLGDTDDWCNVQPMNCLSGELFKEGGGVVPDDWDKRIGWGNDSDGHVEIVKVELLDGYPNGTEIPLEDFNRDVGDFLIYHEG